MAQATQDFKQDIYKGFEQGVSAHALAQKGYPVSRATIYRWLKTWQQRQAA